MVAPASCFVWRCCVGNLRDVELSETGFGNLDASRTIRPVIFSILFLVLGGQTALAGCFFGIINLLAARRAQQTLKQIGVPATAERPLSDLSSAHV